MAMSTRLHRLADHGQNVWIDFLSRELLESRYLFNNLYAAGVDYDDVVAT
jgi:hypothetical protein